MRILFVVTHLLGTGHLSRTLALARAFAEAGWSARAVSGGVPAPHLAAAGVELVQLPPLASDGANFRRLLTPEGAEASAADLAARRAALLAAHSGFGPDVLVTELFPFGRRILAAEFEALLAAASAAAARPLVLSSIRDILAPPSKAEKVLETERRLQRFYDGVLVHSDPALTPLEASWPATPAIQAKLHYTGYVAPPPLGAPGPGDGAGETLVAAGGGPVGGRLFAAAIEAARATPELAWRLLVGGGADRAADLARNAPKNAVVEPPRPDFRQMLARAACFVGQCGYNTALDVLAAGCPAVFAPFEEGGESEQRLRAEALSGRVGYAVLDEASLTPAALAEATRAQIARGRPKRLDAAMDGARRSVEIVAALRASR